MLYKIFKEKIFNKEVGEYESYGIECYNGRKISDICIDYERLNNFVDSLNDYEVSIKHIDYFIQEFLEDRNNIIYKEKLE